MGSMMAPRCKGVLNKPGHYEAVSCSAHRRRHGLWAGQRRTRDVEE